MELGRTAYFGRFTNLTNLTLVENCNPHPVMRKAGAISKSERPHGRRLADQVSSKIKARARGKSKTKVLAIGTPITWKIGNIAKPSRYAAGFDKALANQQRLKPLVKTYAKAFERSRQIGQPVTTVYRFLLQHHPALDGLTGREALEQGKSKQAIEAAESIARYSA